MYIKNLYNPGRCTLARYGEIGTYAVEGWRLECECPTGGKIFAYDARRLQRTSARLGWGPTTRTGLKLEIDRDLFAIIETPSSDPQGVERIFYILELYALLYKPYRKEQWQ